MISLIYNELVIYVLDSLRDSFARIGTIQRRLACPLRKDDTHKSRICYVLIAKDSNPLNPEPGTLNDYDCIIVTKIN